MTILRGDFETYSTLELKDTGVHKYADPRHTGVWCFAHAFDDEEPQIWAPGRELDPRVRSHIESGGELHAWNASFEFHIWNKICVPVHGFPRLDIEQVHCSMAAALAMGLPASLGLAAPALGLDITKDQEGRRLMLQMAKPRAPRKGEDKSVTYWWDDEDRKSRLFEYCKQDVRTERAISKRVFPLSAAERQVWLLDQRINDRGVRVDVKAVRAAIELVAAERRRLDAEMQVVTGGAVDACSAATALTNWVQGHGVDTSSIRKSDVVDLLAREDLPASVRRALELRQEAGKVSTAKLPKMLDGANEDDKLRGLFGYHGAARTGRFNSKRVQVHNMIRASPIEFVFEVMNSVTWEEAA